MGTRKKIAVLFGGRSPEHDISVITGLQCINAMNSDKYEVIPVYVSPEGKWYVGEELLKQGNYLLDLNMKNKLTRVSLDINVNHKGVLLPTKEKLIGKNKAIEFDVALPIFHGLFGEDGRIQGMFELANIPYAGMRSTESSVFMNKSLTKKVLNDFNIPQLPGALIQKPDTGLLHSEEKLQTILDGWQFPCCVKPCHLGSSIGVARVNNISELNEVLPSIFKYDTHALVEPFIQNLLEFNIAVRKNENDEILTSAIEKPILMSEMLDFKQKYLSGESDKLGTKQPGEISDGLLSLTRTINPELSKKLEEDIIEYASTAYMAVCGSGVPRIDFLYDNDNEKLWLNEINPIPGSLAYFLWEKAKQPVLFTELLDHLIDEAIRLHQYGNVFEDPVPEEAQIFKR